MMNGDGNNGFFAKHVEKIVLGLVALMALFLIYSGLQQPNYLREQQPPALEQLANNVRQSIDNDRWEAIQEERVAPNDFPARVARAQSATEPDAYETMWWEYRAPRSGAKRQDPELTAPGKPRVVGVLGALAVRSRTAAKSPFDELEEADEIEVEEKPAPRDERRQRRRRGGDMYGDMMMEDYMSSMEDQMAMDYGYSGMDGLGGGAKRTLRAEYDHGFRPPTTGAGAMPGTGTGTGRSGAGAATPSVTTTTGHFIAGALLMPHRKLAEAYEAAFKDARGGDPRRDLPTYWNFEVQRADVTDDPEPQQWQRVATWTSQDNLRKSWGFEVKDFVPPAFRDPRLSHSLPPLLLRDMTWFGTHPDLPREEPRAQRPTPQVPLPLEAEEPADEDDDFVPAPSSRPRGMGGMGGEMYGMGGDMYSGMGGGDMYGMGGDMYSGMSGGMGYGSRVQSARSQPEYKLIRFYDFADRGQASPQPGRKYVYRVRVALEDPNFPSSAALQPDLRHLSDEVYDRVAVKIQESEQREDKRRDAQIWTDWSELSDPVSLPPTQWVVAGPTVNPAELVTRESNGGRVHVIERRPAAAKMVAVRWDRQLHTDVPLTMEGSAGLVLAKRGDAEVVNPLNREVKKKPNAAVATGSVLVDVVGGETIDSSLTPDDDEELATPAWMLVFDDDGGLRVLDEIDDQRSYRMYTFADEREGRRASPATGGAMYPSDMGGNAQDDPNY